MTIFVSSACGKKKENKLEILNTEKLEYLKEIQANGDLVFEWLGNYNINRPTIILFHGETPNYEKRFDMNLDTNEYTVYNETSMPSDYVVEKANSGYNKQGFNADVLYYWQRVALFNVVIFHWESFADDDIEAISSKLYTVPKMRYKKADKTFETNKVPKAALASIVTSLYIKEMEGKATGKEIRFVGNGAGANLALSVCDLLASYYKEQLISGEYLPARLALCDPYLSSDNMYLDISWDKYINTSNGTLGMINHMISKINSIGITVEMIENKAIEKYKTTTIDEYGKTVEVELNKETYAYQINRKNAAIKDIFDEILSKIAYLEIAQSYSLKFSEKYLAYKRIALDWYLTSIIGSDDINVGYPLTESNNNSNCNWGIRNTRPILNNRYPNNDSSSSVGSNRGKNYGVSAWTPTVYTRALRGISFTQKKKTTNASSDVHDNMRYNYSEYILQHFCVENYQKSNQNDYTLICGYVYLDKNKDAYINDGITAGIGSAKINFSIMPSKDADKPIAEFDATTDDSGFYVIKLNDKTVENGDESQSGYKFNVDHEVTLTYIISSPKYVYQSLQASGIFYETVSGHNFSSATCKFTLNHYYADAITVKNCLLIPESEE